MCSPCKYFNYIYIFFIYCLNVIKHVTRKKSSNAQQGLPKKNLTKFDEKISSSPRQQYFCDDILTSTLTLNFLHIFRTCVGSNRGSLFWYQRFN